MSERIAINRIRTDGGTQMRVQLDMEVIAEYAEAIEEGEALPAVAVFYDGTDYWLGDGFSRVNAAKRLDWLEIDCDVRAGTREDAIEFAASANLRHGRPAKLEDRKNAACTLLRHARWWGRSDNWIGKTCGVDNETVARLRKQVEPPPGICENANGPRQTSDGRTYPATIGKREKFEDGGTCYACHTVGGGHRLNCPTLRAADANGKSLPPSGPSEALPLEDEGDEPEEQSVPWEPTRTWSEPATPEREEPEPVLQHEFFQSEAWKPHHRAEAEKLLHALPQEDRPRAVALIAQPMTPPIYALESLSNLAQMERSARWRTSPRSFVAKCSGKPRPGRSAAISRSPGHRARPT